MKLSDISIKRPVFTTMVMLALMTLGILGGRNLGVDLFPDISFPIVSVVTVYRGAGPTEVERLVTKQIEEAVASINGVDEVRSFSRDSYSTVIVQFTLETDIKAASADVREKLASIAQRLPKEIDQPVIERFDPTSLPILTYAVSSSRNSAQTRRMIEAIIKPKLEAIDGVASVNILGGLEREIHVDVDRRALESLGLSLDQIARVLNSSGNDVPAGKLYLADHDVPVKTIARFDSIETLSRMVVAAHRNGSQVLLSEIATVSDSYKNERVITQLNGVDAVTFEVQKQGGSNTVAIADEVYKILKGLEPILPPDIKLVKAIDNSSFIRNNIHEVTEALIFGGFMAILVIFLFMLDWRSTFISSLALPTSVVSTFFVMWWLGFTFNMMSLLGLSLAIGLLIDDAVVVRENIFRHMERGEDPFTAARRGTAEIALAVMATTLAIVAVFIPVAFMDGIVGRMFKEFGLTVASAVMVSLFVSFTLDPMMSARVVKPVAPDHHEKLLRHRIYGPIVRFLDRLNANYHAILVWSLQRPKTVIMIALLLFMGSLGLVSLMGKEFVSNGDRGEFRLNLELSAGASLLETSRVVTQVEELARKNSEVRELFSVIGANGESNKASVRVYTTKANERPNITQIDIEHDLRSRLSAIPSLRFNISEIGMVEGSAEELAITLHVRGENFTALQSVADRVQDVVKSVNGTTDVDSSFRSGKPELAIVPNRARADDRLVNIGSLAQITRIALEGDVVGKFRDKDNDIDIRLKLADKDRLTTASIADITVPNRQGALVRVGEIANLIEQTGPASIERMDRQRQITISANVVGRSLGEVSADIEKALKSIDKPAGVSFAFGGQTERMQETFANMGLALFIAVVFIYFVLASQFESFVHPFTIMVTLPLALVGALVTLFLSGFAIGLSSLIGIVLLMGLVTKNAILLVDCANTYRENGHSVEDALLKAGPIRLRPILMTSAAMVLGMLPTAIKGGEGASFRAPMATAVIGGVIVSTFLTLVVVPVVYLYMDKINFKAKRSEHDVNTAKSEK